MIQLLLMLRPSWNKVEMKFYQLCFNVTHRRCINVVQRWNSDFGFCFILNIRSTLFQRWSATLKQPWCDVGMLAGIPFPRKTIFWTFKLNPFLKMNSFRLDYGQTSKRRFPTNKPHRFHVETMSKQSFPRRFSMESMWCVCRTF